MHKIKTNKFRKIRVKGQVFNSCVAKILKLKELIFNEEGNVLLFFISRHDR